MAAGGHKQNFHELDLAFHEMLSTPGLPRSRRQPNPQGSPSTGSGACSPRPSVTAATVSEHERIVDALEKRDGRRPPMPWAPISTPVMCELMSFARREPELFTDWQDWKTDKI